MYKPAPLPPQPCALLLPVSSGKLAGLAGETFTGSLNVSDAWMHGPRCRLPVVGYVYRGLPVGSESASGRCWAPAKGCLPSQQST